MSINTRTPAARRRLCALLALVLALAVVATASAAGSLYKGKVKSGGALRFRATATSVTGFQASVTVVCTSATAAGYTKIYLIRGLPAGKLVNGRFTINYHGPFSTYITVKGTIKGSSASGNINIHYTALAGGPIYACQFKGPWSAKKA